MGQMVTHILWIDTKIGSGYLYTSKINQRIYWEINIFVQKIKKPMQKCNLFNFLFLKSKFDLVYYLIK